VGQTLSVVVDPPSVNVFFDIETIRFNSGGGSVCPGCSTGTNERFRLRMFNWIEWLEDPLKGGRWAVNDVPTSLFLTDRAPGEHPDFPQGAAGTNAGVKIDFTLTGAETFSLTMIPLDNPAAAYMTTGDLMNPGTGSIDWIEFEHYGRPTPVPDPNAEDTDFFIRSLEVTGPAPATNADFDGDGDRDGADFLAWQRGFGTPTGALRAQGNADGDGDVDGNDLAIWRQQFGQTGMAPVVNAVPEPSTLATAAAAAGLLGHAAGRRRTNARRNA
jgi:hypothetical protein